MKRSSSAHHCTPGPKGAPRAYAGMREDEKARVRQALKLIFPDKDLPEPKG